MKVVLMMQLLLSQALNQAVGAGSATNQPLDWSKYQDSVLISVERLPEHKMGNTICTGVLIHPRAILTAAHCAEDAVSMTVTFDVEKGNQSRQKLKVMRSQILFHPDYHPSHSLYQNDVAILFLDQSAPVGSSVIKKIPSRFTLSAGDSVFRIGVGMRNGKNLRNFTEPKFVSVPEKGVLETADFHSISGDSGGPLYSASGVLLGIHSTLDDFDGKKNPHSYAVYLPDHVEWIDRNLKSRFQSFAHHDF